MNTDDKKVFEKLAKVIEADVSAQEVVSQINQATASQVARIRALGGMGDDLLFDVKADGNRVKIEATSTNALAGTDLEFEVTPAGCLILSETSYDSHDINCNLDKGQVLPLKAIIQNLERFLADWEQDAKTR